MKRIFPIIIATLCLCNCGHHRGDRGEAEIQNDTIYPLGFLTDTLELVEGKISSGETFTTLFAYLGMPSPEVYNLAQACDSCFDPRKIVAGNSYEAYFTVDSTERHLHYLVYRQDRIHNVIFQCFDSLSVWTYDKPIEKKEKQIDVIIQSSLWNDMIAAGATPLLTLKLSDIYSWTVDFFGLREGDRFRTTYLESSCDGEVIGVDSVYFSIFSRGEKDMFAILFDQGDGGNLYWNEKGESMRKAFLKAPLQFSRISSGFSYARKHPISGKVKPHTAIDYAAPTGTPVLTIGDGTVIQRSYDGANGNMVKIRHNSVYTSAYLHLSKFASGLKVGQRVKQGELIGYVGSTGSSTGPHLDFRIWMNGSPVNPLTIDSPSEEPIKEENRAALDSVYRYYLSQYGLLSEPDPVQ